MAGRWTRILIVMAAAVLSGAACMGADESATTAPPSATSTPAPEGPQRLEIGILAAGEYRTNRFAPTLVFTLPAGWAQFFADDSDEISLGGPDTELYMSRPTQVVDPGTGEPVDTPESLAEWFAAHPAFGSPTPMSVEIAGRQSTIFDLPGASADVDLFAFATGNFHTVEGIPVRVYIVPLAGADLVLTIVPRLPRGTIEDAITAAAPVVESLEIGE